MNRKIYDVTIVGGGIMGSAVAYYLMRFDGNLKVIVVERDPAYTHASSTLSLANVRTQFSLKENILISKYTLEVLKTFDNDMAAGELQPHISFRSEGNLFLVDERGRESAKKSIELQQSLKCPVSWLTPDQISNRYPLYRTNKFYGGTFGRMDGHLDAYAFLMGYRNKAKALGALFVQDEVLKILKEKNRVCAVGLISGKKILSENVVNCAGAWASQIAKSVGVPLPVQPVKRQVFVLKPAVLPEEHLPLTVLPSGLYFRTDTGGVIILGKSMPDDPVGFEFSWDDKRFLEILWPELADFVPAFDTLKLLRGWAGLYAVNTLDGNAILGEWPELKGFFLANGFSGHGLQQAPAVGRYIAEQILKRSPALDLAIFDPTRILLRKPLTETGLV
jgi:glycine/D-amino acid oxidase-like deaminating enzyme